MTCRIVETACRNSDEKRPYGFELTRFCTRYHEQDKVFIDDVRVRPVKATGFEYEAVNTGLTGKKKFVFPIVLDETVLDGSVSWAAKAISNASLERTIDSSDWIVPAGSNIVVSDEAFINTNGMQVTSCQMTGGTLASEEAPHRVINRVTFSDGTVEDFGIDLEVK